MKFLFAPEYNRIYDMRVAHSLGRALAELGQHYTILEPGGCAVKDLSGYDVVFGVNRARPDDLNPGTIFISWIQDYRPGQFIDYVGRAGKNDIIYTLGSEQWIGFTKPGPNFRGSLLMGVDQEAFDERPAEHTLDFSICGYIPLPFNKLDLGAPGLRCIQELERQYKPLTGSSNAFVMANIMQEFVDKLIITDKVPVDRQDELRRECNWLSIEYCRYIDRLRLAQLAYYTSPKCGFYGVNWRKYYQFGDCTFAPVREEDKLRDIYRQSRINLHCNWNGFGLHHRVLESMACGGFIMAHACADPQAAGRLTVDFEPDVHFGEYTPEDFNEQAKYWVAADDKRNQAVAEARKIVAAKHLWKHRAEQILEDLH